MQVTNHFHLMLLLFQSLGLCVQSPSIIPVPEYANKLYIGPHCQDRVLITLERPVQNTWTLILYQNDDMTLLIIELYFEILHQL